MNNENIKKYRSEVAARPFETSNEHRNRVGTISRYVHLKNQDLTRWQRQEEVKRYHEAVLRVEQEMIPVLADARAKNLNSFREKQIIQDAPLHQLQHDKKMAESAEYRAMRERKKLEAMDHIDDRDLSGADDAFVTALSNIQEEE